MAPSKTVPTVTIVPVRDLLVVEPEPPAQLKSTFLEVVDLTPKSAYQGTVLAVGPEVRDVKVGQRILFSRLQGYDVLGKIVLAEGAVLATEEE